ncbi:MAG: cytochrome c [Isosphaeraceae bacterium]
MNRKWTVLAAAMLSTALLVSGIAVAQDDDKELTPLGKVMEEVQTNHVKILKSYRTAVSWTKGQQDAAEAAGKIIELGKKARPLGGPAIKEMKKTQEQWDEKMDTFLKEAEAFSKFAGQAGIKNAEAKKAYSKVSASCTSCHNDFRSEDDE